LKIRRQKIAFLNHQLKRGTVRVWKRVHPSMKHIVVCSLVKAYFRCVINAYAVIIAHSIYISESSAEERDCESLEEGSSINEAYSGMSTCKGVL
jgi:hypothetical protein